MLGLDQALHKPQLFQACMYFFYVHQKQIEVLINKGHHE